MKNGFCVQKWKDGKTMTGYFLKDKMNGWAKIDNLEVLIKGEFKDGFLNGYGEVLKHEENVLFVGYWIKGVSGGVGYEQGNNYIYFGNFINDKKDGYGKQIWDDKDVYEGEWKDNDFNGYGIYSYHNGKKYVGQFKNSEKNGVGELSFPDGKKYVGYFKNGLHHGFGIYYLKKENVIISFWNEGKRHGLGKYIHNEKIYYQIWEDNKPIEKDMKETVFMDKFDDNIKKYRHMFKLNINEIMKFLDINE